MASEDSIYGLILQLCNHHVPALKPFYGRDVNCNFPDVQFTKKKKLAKKLHKIAYSTLLKFIQISRNGKFQNCDGFSEIHSLLAIVYNMRVSRKFDDANALETHLNKLKGDKNCLSDETRSCLRLLICLHDTGKIEKPCLGELQPFPKVTPDKGECCILPHGPMVYGDTRLSNKTGFFTLFPREVFEEVRPITVTPSAAQQSALFEICPGYDLNGNELFNISTSQSFKEEKDDSQSLLGALFHRPRVRQKNLLGIKLEIPEISSSSLRPLDFKLSINSDSGFGSSIKKSMINTLSEDEGFIESESPLSARSTGVETEDIWDAALKIEPRACFSWETIGCYSIEKPKPYLSEAGPKAIDMIYQTHQHEMMLMDSSFHFDVPIALSQSTLSRDVISLLIGIPSETFLFINSTSSFEVRRGIYITGMTPESLSKFFSCFIETGSLYRKLEEFSSGSEHGTTYIEGLVMQALKDGISRYLQCYRASILSLADKYKEFRILELQQKFRRMCQQIRFLADFCKIKFYSGKCSFAEKLLVGVELLTYLYEKSLEQWGQENYLLSLFLLKSASTPYLHFLHEWLFEGVCNDSYNEFHVQQNFLYLHCKDEMYWTKCFLQTTQELSKCVPQFLSHIASDILVCGKSVNLLKLCYPKHYLCSTKAELPPLVLSFSERVVNQIKLSSQQYMDYMLDIAQQEKLAAEQLQRKEEEEKQVLLQQNNLKRSETLAKIQEQLDEAQKTTEEKKQKQMSDLKAQIEENSLLRQLEKEKLIQEENKRIALMEEQQEKEMQIKKEIEAEYQKRALELEKREQQAKLLFEKLQKDSKPMKHGESSQTESSETSSCEEKIVEETVKELPHIPDTDFQNKQNDDISHSVSTTEENLTPPESYNKTTDSQHITTVNVVEGVQPDTECLSEIHTKTQNTSNLHSVQLSNSDVPQKGSQEEYPSGDDPGDNAEIFDTFRKVVKETEECAEAERGKKRRSWHEYVTEKAAGDVDDIMMSPSGVLFSTGSRTALRSRGINVHGHASDSTIQNYMYSASPGQASFKHRCQSPNKLKDNQLKSGKNVEVIKEETSIKSEDFVREKESSAAISRSAENLNCYESNIHHETTKKSCSPSNGDVSDKLIKSLEHPAAPKPITVGRHGSLPSLTHTKIFEEGGDTDQEYEAELRSHISQTVLRHRGKNVHGHSSDSTIQDVIYGSQNNLERTKSVDDNENELLTTATEVSKVDNCNRLSHSSETTDYDNKSVAISPEDIKNGNVDGAYCQSKESELCNERSRETPKEAATYCTEDTKTSLVIQQGSDLLPATYNPTYCKNYAILDKEPLPGLMTNIPKSSSFTAEEDEDIASCHYTPLLALINRSLLPVIQAQIKLVNKSMIDYFIMNLNINDHFMALRNFFFFYDGEFGHSLSQILFDKVSQCNSPVDLLSPFTLNTILSQALSMSLQGDSVYAEQLSFSIKAVPLATLTAVPNVLSCIKLRYKVEWPCNIVITEKNMVYYNSVLELLLQVKRCHWSLTDVWFHLKRDSKHHKLDLSPQYRQLQIYRHEMLHFARVMQSYIASQVLQVTWKEFQNILENKVNSLDDLRDAHASYLKKACYRCLLSKKAAPVMKIIKDVLSSILKYRSVLLKYDWVTNDNSRCLEHPAFETLITIYKTFHEHSCFLYKVLKQLVLKGYQPHLKDFLVKLDFNNFYQMATGNSTDLTEDLPS